MVWPHLPCQRGGWGGWATAAKNHLGNNIVLTRYLTAALHQLRLFRPFLAVQRVPGYFATPAPDPAGAAGHPGYFSLSRLGQLLRPRSQQPQPHELPTAAACQPDSQGHPHHQPQHRDVAGQPPIVDFARDDADSSAPMVRSLRFT